MVTTISKVLPYSSSPDTSKRLLPQASTYKYDQLNRIVEMQAYQNINANTNSWASGSTYAGLYHNSFSYDASGNILTQIRNDSSGHVLDNLTYHYAQLNGRTIANRLYHVNDSIASNYSSTDIDDQGSYDSTLTEINSKNNYSYDAIGQLVKDKQEQIDTIYWSVYGKIRYVKRSSGSPKPSLSFDYDASGNRIAKNVFSAGNHSLIYSDYYVRDAQGNQLAIYRKQATGAGLSFELRERNIFGSSLVGTSYDSLQLIGSVTQTDTTSHYLGKKNYFLENHLSNILSTISDKKIPQVNNATDTLVGYYGPLVMSSTDYSAFGAIMPGRNYNANSYRYGAANGQEKADEISGNGNHYTAEYWEYDPRIGRRWNRDQVVKHHESPYAAFANNPIWLVDPNGRDTSFADNNARQQFKSTYKSVDNAIKGLDSKIENKLAKWQEKGYDNERLNKRMTRQIGRLNEKRSQLTEIKNSFDEVINSDVMYFYTAKPNPDGKYLSGGGTSYNTDKDRVDIWFYSGNKGTIVHETRHGAGYSWGEWGWNSSTNSPTNYDYQDEYEAYRQESIYFNVFNVGIGRTKLEIMNVIKENYGNKVYISH